jgi:hypothetical protein
MAGKLVLSTLNDDTGVFAIQNGMRGIAKAWVNFGGGQNSTAGVINGTSFNVSSITVNGTGDYTVNFTTAMPNTNYIVLGGVQENNNDAGATTNRVTAPKRTPLLTTSVRVGCVDFNYSAQNVFQVYVATFST